MYNADDAIARVDGYIVNVTGAGSRIGERKLVRIESVERSSAVGSLVNPDEVTADEDEAEPSEQVESPTSGSRGRRGRRGGRGRSRAGQANE